MQRVAAVGTAVVLGVTAGALYTVSPLAAWCAALAAIVLALAGRGLPASEHRALNIVLVAALVARLAAVGATFIINTPMHDDESVAMLSGDEAYGLSRALRTRDVVQGTAATQYDYVVAYDEYGRNSYIALLSGIQVLFGPTPYSMRLLNVLFFVTGAVLLFRAARSGFGALPAFGGLIALLFLPSLFYWSISLLKEPLYLLGASVVLTGAIGVVRAARWHARMLHALAALAGLAVVGDMRPGAIALTLLGLGCGGAALVFLSSSLRVKATTAVAALIVTAAVTSQPAAQARIASAIETAAKTHAGHVFTVGHSYKLLDDGFYASPAPASASSLTLTSGEAGRYLVRAALSFVLVPLPWQIASTRELAYLPEQLVWYVVIALLPIGLAAGWRRDRLVTCVLAGYTLPTAAALALVNGNVGTLLRLRGIVIPYLLWLSAAGLCAALQRFATRTATS